MTEPLLKTSCDATKRRGKDGPDRQAPERAPRELLVEEIPRLRRFARHLAGNADQADDLVNECLVRALGRLETWRPGTSMRAWLFVILRHCLYDDYRRAQRRPLVDTELVEEQMPQVSGGQEARVALDEVDKAFSRLADEHQKVIYHVAVEGRRYEEAANRLDIPVGTVRSRLSRARESLRQALDTS